MFSTRIPADLRPNPLTRTLRRLRRQGTPILDLTESNPTRVGLRYPPGLFDGLAGGAATYDPDPLGAVAARAAVAAYIEAEGIRVRPEQVVLTASTSDAYALLFKVLCDPGDEVLMPQLKLSWMAIGGAEPMVKAAVSRLELACDTYLSVASPVQHALPQLLTRGLAIRAQIDARLRRNLETLREAAVRRTECHVLPVEGGWSAIVQVPATVGEERRVLDLLEYHQVLVHPGYFFDFQTEAFLVCSLLPEPGVFDEALPHLFTD